MKRLFLILLIATLPLASLRAQSGTISNSFVAIGLGPNVYFSSQPISFGGGADLALGKWLLNTVALRTQLSAQYSVNHGTQNHTYFYGDVNLMFDLLTALKGRNPSDIIRSYLFVGVGLVHTGMGDNDFCGIAGLGCDFKIGEIFRLGPELQAFIHPSDFDDNTRSSLLSHLRVNASFDIKSNPTRSRSRLETQQLSNDWFFQVALGVTSFNYKGIEDFANRLSLLTPIFNFGVGKRLNNVWQIRISATGLYAKSNEELFSYYNVAGDLMVDAAGLLYRRNLNPTFTARPFLSASIVNRLDDQSHFLFSPAAGLQLSVRPRKNHEIFLEGRYIVTPPRFAHVAQSQGTLSVGLATITLGYGYIFSKNSFR